MKADYVVHYVRDGEVGSVIIEDAADEREAANRAALRVVGAHGERLTVVLIEVVPGTEQDTP